MISGYRALLLLPLALAASVQAQLSIVSRAAWNAQEPNGDMTAMALPLGRAVIAHTAGHDCTDDQSCAAQTAAIQRYAMTQLRQSDISYHYLIGGNGRVYEGRSPAQQAAIAAGNNADNLAIAFIGTFTEKPPTDEALAALTALLEHAVSGGQLSQDYKLLGHRQLSITQSPGDALYAIIMKLPRWSSN